MTGAELEQIKEKAELVKEDLRSARAAILNLTDSFNDLNETLQGKS